MKTDKLKRVLIGLSAILFAASCGKSEEKVAEEKAVSFAAQGDDRKLRSSKFGITVTPPEGWHTMDFDQLNNLVDTGTDVVTAGQDDLRAMIEASEKNSYNLFAILQYESGAPVDENPNVMGMAENISAAPGVKRGKDYFFHAKKIMAQGNPTFVFEEGYKTRMIGGVEFDQMDLTMEIVGISAKQSYYAAKYENFIVTVVQTYMSDEGKEATSGIIDTIELDW